MIVIARLLRRTECMAQVVPPPMPTTAAPKHCHGPLSFSAAPKQNSGRKRRKQVRVEGLYLEREPEPILQARALLQLIQEECPEKVGSFVPRGHLERAYHELCDHEGWKAYSWMAIARALGTLTCRKLLKRNGVRFVAYRVSAPLTKSRRPAAAPVCPGIAPAQLGISGASPEKPGKRW
jgi:hypothetical protein